jgi:hypothetical protein
MIFQPSIAGYYIITLSGYFDSGQSNNNLQIVSGSTQLYIAIAPTNGNVVEGIKAIYFNGTTDSVKLTAYATSPSFLRSNNSTFFSGQLITSGIGPTGAGATGPTGNTGATGATGSTGSTFTTLSVSAGSPVITSPTSFRLVTSGNQIITTELLNSSTEGIYLQCALPAVSTSGDELVIGLLNNSSILYYSITLTNGNAYTLYYDGSTHETGTYTTGSILSIYLDGSSVFFDLDGYTLNTRLSVTHAQYRFFGGATTATTNYTISNVRFYPTGRAGASGVSLVPAADATYDLGTASLRWRDIYTSASTIYIGNAKLSADNAGNLIHTATGGAQTMLNSGGGSGGLTLQMNYTTQAVPTDGVVTTLAQGGSSSFIQPSGIVVDSAGDIYIAEYGNHRIFKVTSSGVVTRLAGSGTSTGTSGSTNGTGTNASFTNPVGIGLDSAGNVYVADSGNNLIRKITPAGVVTTFAGDGTAGFADGTGTNARFNGAGSLAVDLAGNVYVGDNTRVRKITPAGVVTTFAGSGTSGSTDGTGTNATFTWCSGMAVDFSGNVYVAQYSTGRVRKISPLGVVTTLASSGMVNPYGVTVDFQGTVYVADHIGASVRRITSAGVVSTVAGSGSPAFQDGTGSGASFWFIPGVAVNSAGNIVYVADEGNNRIRKITLGTNPNNYSGSPSLEHY